MANSYEDYQKQLANIYEQIQNRGPFEYDMNADPLYQQYKDSYINSGKLAMKDTMGQAAGLTGGYGSTYGQQVGQQAYNSYLQNMSQQIPSLYELAYNMYRDRGDDLMKQYAWLKANPVEKPVPAGGGSGGGGGGGGDGKGDKLGLGAVAGATGGLAAGLMAALGGVGGNRKGYTLGELLASSAGDKQNKGASKAEIEAALKARGVDVSSPAVQQDIKWALSK